MKRLTSILPVLAGFLTVILVQGFPPGAMRLFVGDPPIVSEDNLPVADVAYWWVSSDLATNDYVTNWVDRINSSTWTNHAFDATTPTNSSLGVHFQRSASQRLTNVVTYAINTQPSSHWIIMERSASGVFQDFLDATTGGNFNWWFDPGDRYAVTVGGSSKYLATSPANQLFDWLIVMDNAGGTIKFYTNGVAGYTNNVPPIASIEPWRYMGGIAAQGYFTGYIRELAVWSNTVVSATGAADLHAYATNKYGYSP